MLGFWGAKSAYVNTPYAAFRGGIADVVLHSDLSRPRLSLRSDRRIGETCGWSGGAAEREPADGTRFVRYGVAAGLRREGRFVGATVQYQGEVKVAASLAEQG